MKKLKPDNRRKLDPDEFPKPKPKPKLCPKCKWMHSCPDARIHQREYCTEYEQDKE